MFLLFFSYFSFSLSLFVFSFISSSLTRWGVRGHKNIFVALKRKSDFISMILIKSVMIILSESSKDYVSYFHKDNLTQKVFVIVSYDNGYSHLILTTTPYSLLIQSSLRLGWGRIFKANLLTNQELQ